MGCKGTLPIARQVPGSRWGCQAPNQLIRVQCDEHACYWWIGQPDFVDRAARALEQVNPGSMVHADPMVSVPRQGQAGVRWLLPPAIAAIGLVSTFAPAAATPGAGAHAARIIPAVGSY